VLSHVAQAPWVRLPLVIAVVLAIQTSLVTDVRPFGVAADLMLLLAVCAGLVAGSERGAIAAFVIGLAFDLVLQTPFGLSALVYAVVAFSLGYLRLGIERSGWWARLVVVDLASMAAVFGFALLGSLFGMTRIVNARLVGVAVVVGLVNAALAPVALPVMRWTLLGGEHDRPVRVT
jgi:rod shape-determining protein MreD